MQDGDGAETLAGLNRAAMSGKLPAKMQDVAVSLRDRLAEPVRVTVLGLPGSGKSQVVNLLAGAQLVPEGVTLPVLRLVAGVVPRMMVTFQDGTTDEYDDLDPGAVAAESPLMVEMQADLPALRKITLMEVGVGLSRIEQQRAVAWVSERSDIAIWCTRDFGPAEQAAWTSAPDVLKYQGILLRTRIDTAPNAVAAVNRAERLGADEFERILPIDTLAAIAARRPDGTVDRDALRASGGTALISAVLKMVERTRQALIDQGDLLLARYPEAAETPRSGAATRPMARPDPPKVPPVAAPSVAAAKPAPTPEPEPIPRAEPNRLLAEGTVAPASEPVTPDRPEPPRRVAPEPGTRKAFEAAVARLRACAAELVAGDAPPDPGHVMNRSVAELDWLCAHLDDLPGRDPVLSNARGRAQDAADMVQLMRIEGGDGNAEDAVALMLQMRRGLSQAIATSAPH